MRPFVIRIVSLVDPWPLVLLCSIVPEILAFDLSDELLFWILLYIVLAL